MINKITNYLSQILAFSNFHTHSITADSIPPAQRMENHIPNSDIIRAMSFNIRVDHEEDRDTENDWRYRLHKVTHVIQKHDPDILALQEPSEMQIKNLQKKLGRKYSWILAPASDRDPSSEVLAIAYKNKRFQVKNSGRFWLAPDPEKEPSSHAWDGSRYPRIAMFGTLEDKMTKKTFQVWNTHFDHKGRKARSNSAEILARKANEIANQSPFLIMGDFNTFQNDHGLEAYEKLKRQKILVDVREAAEKVYGPESTWIGWDYSPWNAKKMQKLFPNSCFRLDHIFLSKNGFQVHRTAALDDRFKMKWKNEKKEVYPSDHRPLIVDFQLQDSQIN